MKCVEFTTTFAIEQVGGQPTLCSRDNSSVLIVGYSLLGLTLKAKQADVLERFPTQLPYSIHNSGTRCSEEAYSIQSKVCSVRSGCEQVLGSRAWR